MIRKGMPVRLDLNVIKAGVVDGGLKGEVIFVVKSAGLGVLGGNGKWPQDNHLELGIVQYQSVIVDEE